MTWRRAGETPEGETIHENGRYRISSRVDETSGVVGPTRYWYVERDGEMLAMVNGFAEAKAFAARDEVAR